MKYVWTTLDHIRISHCSSHILERNTHTNEIIVDVKLSEDCLGMSLRSHSVLMSLWVVNECHWRPYPGVNLCMYTSFHLDSKRKKTKWGTFLCEVENWFELVAELPKNTFLIWNFCENVNFHCIPGVFFLITKSMTSCELG